MLQTWVAESENRNACESRVVVSRETANSFRGQRELLSIRDMLLTKKWPLEKIKGVISRGGGIPDPDAPQVPSLMQFWVQTSRTQTEEEAIRMKAETRFNAQTTPEGIGALMQGNMVPRGNSVVSAEQLQQITDGNLGAIEGIDRCSNFLALDGKHVNSGHYENKTCMTNTDDIKIK